MAKEGYYRPQEKESNLFHAPQRVEEDGFVMNVSIA
jgi:hypothetical protein